MTLPSQKDIEEPLLRFIAEQEGEIRINSRQRYPFLDLARRYFPQTTPQDLSARVPSGKDYKFDNSVRWGRNELCKKGELERPAPEGVWRITPKGLVRIGAHVAPVFTVSPPLPADLVKEIAEMGVDKSGGGIWRSASVSPPPPPQPVVRPSPITPPPPLSQPRRHEELVEKLVTIGNNLGKHASRGGSQYDNIDVIWKVSASSMAPLTHVFEVHDKGSPHSALAKLQGALAVNQLVKAFLVVVEPGESPKVQAMIQQNFPVLRGQVNFLTGEQVDALYTTLGNLELQTARALFGA